MTSPRDGLEIEGCGSAASGAGEIRNPPGLSALERRIGTRAEFLARMLDRLSTETLPDGVAQGRVPLSGLAGRQSDDPAVALLDAWAGVADVLTFYQERIANEGSLRTALESRSVLELARLVGQEPGPGVAASVFLDFTVDDAPGSPTSALVPRGTKVQSIPGQNELPQIFETEEDFTARVEWNALIPRQGKPQSLTAATAELFLAGTGLRLAPGDVLLVGPAIAQVAAVALDVPRQLTRITLQEPLSTAVGSPGAAFALRQKTAFFGHNAPRWGSLPKSDVQKTDPYAGDAGNWDTGRTIWTDSRNNSYGGSTQAVVYLDRKLSGVVAGSWMVITGRSLAGAPLARAYQITGHTEATLADYAIVGEATRLVLDPNVKPDFDVRQTMAYLISEPLSLAERPIDAPYPAAEEDTAEEGGSLAAVILDRLVQGLPAGKIVAIQGTLVDGGATASRLALLLQASDAPDAPGHTRLVFQQPLPANLFVRSSVRVRANIALATHGETVAEVLGSGDATQPRQRFFLRHLPLTYVPAPVFGGRASTLQVRVDGVLWQEVDTLAAEDGRSQSYKVEIAADGRTAVCFGDGRYGALLPTGTENVTAVYRSGLGLPGLVAAGALRLLATRPLGIREVINPLPATGAAPPDSVERARAGAPTVARTLGRIVSMADFEDFVRSFAGIAKVEASRIGGVLTVAAEGDASVEPGSALATNLMRAIQEARLPGPPLSIASYERLPFRVAAQLVIDPRFRSEDVLSQARAALLAGFSFERRSLSQPVYASDVVALLQAVAGVMAVDLDALHTTGSPAGLASELAAQPARSSGAGIQPAQLLVLEPDAIQLTVRTR